MKKKALLTGITGQDGSYLAELLLDRGYEVHGIVRRASSFNTGRIDHLYQDPHDEDRKLILHYGDLADATVLARLMERIAPDEVYNLAAQSHVKVSFEMPEYTAQVDALGTLRLLDAIREARIETRFYQASTSELFGTAPPPQSETTPFHPRSPYGVAKLYAYWMTVNYREAYGLHAINGILFNHESPRRGRNFVTRKITHGAARIRLGLDEKLYLGNLSARRDWGYAPEFVEGMWRMMQHPEPTDFVLATGISRSVEELCLAAFSRIGVPLEFSGTGVERRGHDAAGKVRVEVDPRYFRPAEVEHLCGDARKAKALLGWEPRVSFEELVGIMVDADLELAERRAADEDDRRRRLSW